MFKKIKGDENEVFVILVLSFSIHASSLKKSIECSTEEGELYSFYQKKFNQYRGLSIAGGTVLDLGARGSVIKKETSFEEGMTYIDYSSTDTDLWVTVYFNKSIDDILSGEDFSADILIREFMLSYAKSLSCYRVF